VLTAIGVPGVGPATCKSLAKQFDDFDELALANREQLVSVDGVSEKAAENLRSFFESPGGEQLVVRLRHLKVM